MVHAGRRGVQAADPGPVREPGQPVLLHRPAVGRRRDRPQGHPDRARPGPVRRGQRAAASRPLRRLQDVSMFDTVLIANRGEIAVRVTSTLRRMGIRSVAVHSDADEGARHVHEADVAVRIGPPAARESYLSIERIIDAALRTGAQAVHPGYGFLAENAAFARACAEAGLVFVGPPPAAIDAMGDKIRAKQTVTAAGVPVVPGAFGADIEHAVAEIGFPVLLKPSAGGGGKGMRLVHSADELAPAIESAQREARNSFGDDTLLAERFVLNPRHIEIQVLADAH